MPFKNHVPCGLIYSCSTTFEESFPYEPVPLQNVHLDVKLVNFSSEVTITQNFVNKESKPIECIYHFPIEEEAAVVDFSAELEGRSIKTQIKAKSEARQEYHDAITNNQTAVLLEETKQDIFEIKVGNLSPGSGCQIKITYIMELPVENKMTKLTIPTTVAPRYTPSPATNETALKISSIQHDTNSPVKMTMTLKILMQTEIFSVTSPSHDIRVTEKTKHQEYFINTAEFSGNTEMMDRDFIVFVDSAEPNKPKVLVEKDEESYVAMLTFVPDFHLVEQNIEAIFVVDCSGSMGGQSMNLAKEALMVFLHSLPVNSYFNVFLFGSRFQSLFPESRIYDDHSFADAKSSAAGISANMGGTEIMSPLQHIFKQNVKTGLARQVFVLTDGQVSNSQQCIDLVRSNAHNNRVFTLGIGSSADRHLVKGMARAGQGTSMFTSQGEQITPKIMQQLKHALQPCIADVQVKWSKEENFQGSAEFQVEIETKKTLFGFGKPKEKAKFTIKNQVPSQIPPIYDGSRLVLYKQLDKNYDVGDEITIKAKTVAGELKHTFNVTSDSFIEGKSLHQLFARKMIQEIEEKNVIENQNESKELILELGLKYNLASKYTSFVGVDTKQNTSHSIFMETRNVKNQTPFGYQMAGLQHRSMNCSLFGSSGTYCDGMVPRGPPPGSQAPEIKLKSYKLSLSRIKKKAAPFAVPQSRISTVADLSEESVDDDDDVNNRSVVLRLTLAQNADGSFPITDDIAKIIGVSLTDMLVFGTNIDPRAWVTLVCIEFLEQVCQDEKNVWELVVLKAQTWVNKNFPNLGQEAKNAAKDFVSKK